MEIRRFFRRLSKKLHTNPAIDILYRGPLSTDERIVKMISDLPDIAVVFRQVEDSLYQKALLEQIREYDVRMGSQLSKKIDGPKEKQMRWKVSSLTLLSFYEVLWEHLQEASISYALTDALHYEMYGSLSSGEGFAEYLDYLAKRNVQSEDQNMTPAHQFGNDIAQIFSISDPTFYFIIAQQAAVISESAGKLACWALFDEPIEPKP